MTLIYASDVEHVLRDISLARLILHQLITALRARRFSVLTAGKGLCLREVTGVVIEHVTMMFVLTVSAVSDQSQLG